MTSKRLGSKVGTVIGLGILAMGAASAIMAVWSGEWRWLLITGVVGLLIKAA